MLVNIMMLISFILFAIYFISGGAYMLAHKETGSLAGKALAVLVIFGFLTLVALTLTGHA